MSELTTSYFNESSNVSETASINGFIPVSVVERNPDTNEIMCEYDTYMAPCAIDGYEDCMVLLAPVDDYMYYVDDCGMYEQTFKLARLGSGYSTLNDGTLEFFDNIDGHIALHELSMTKDEISDEPCMYENAAYITIHDDEGSLVETAEYADGLVHGLAEMMRAICTEGEFDGNHWVYSSL